MNKIRVEELKNDYGLTLGDYGDCICDYSSGYISDIFCEIADNHVSIYNYDLCKWAINNSSYIEDAVAEFGIDGKNFDFFRLIQTGQFLAIEEELRDNSGDILRMFVFDYIERTLGIEEITQEEAEAIEELSENINRNNYETLEEIREELDNIFCKIPLF